MVRRRLRILAICLMIPFAGILTRLYSLQLVPARVLENRKHAEHRSLSFNAPQRGQILARDGTVLVRNQPIHQLYFKYSQLNIRDEPLRALVEELQKNGAFPGYETVERQIVELTGREHFLAPSNLERDDLEDTATWLLLVSGVDAATARRLNRKWRGISQLSEAPLVFEARLDEKNHTHGIWFQPSRALRMETTLERLSRILRLTRRGSNAPNLSSQVAGVLEKIEARVAKEIRKDDEDDKVSPDKLLRKARDVRRFQCQQSWLLIADVPLSVVTEIEYHPSGYPGIECVDGIRREYPLKEAAGTLTGWLRRVDANPEDERKFDEAGKLLDGPRGFPSPEEFEEQRKGAVRRTDWLGDTGLEAEYDEALRGLHGMAILRRDRKNHPRQVVAEVLPRNGQDIQTTLDARLQVLLHEALKKAVQPLGSGTAASVAVMEVPSGAILASVGFPGVDPLRIREDGYLNSLEARWKPQTSSWLIDRPSALPIYPGSVFKIVVAMAAMESAQPWQGAYCETRRYPCLHKFGPIQDLTCDSLNGHTADRNVNLVEALQFSCNVYFYYLGLKHLGPELIQPWAYNLGYGEPTGIDLPSSPFERGTLGTGTEAAQSWQKCHYAIGQGLVKATPLQVLRSYAAIAVGGTCVPRPYLVTPSEPSPLRLANPHTIASIRQGLWRVGHAPQGTAWNKPSRLERFNAAYKTGTAEVWKDGDAALHNGWLAGFAPYDSPRIAFVAVVDRTPLHGAEAAGPIIEILLSYFADTAPEAFLMGNEAAR